MRIFRPTLVAMMSALESTAAPVTVHFFGWRLTQEAHDLLETAIRRYPGGVLRYHEISDRTIDSARERNSEVFSATQLAILHIPRLLEGKVLYLDSDVLVHADIAPLFDIDLGDSQIGAVQCFTCLLDHFTQLPQERNIEARGDEFRLHERLMAPHSVDDRFNSGVVLFNNDVIRSVPGAADAITDNVGLVADQLVLNHHLKGRVFWLNSAWNVVPGLHQMYSSLGYAMTDAKNHSVRLPPKISHFLGHAKPWHDFSLTDLRQSVQKTRESLCRKLGITGEHIKFFFFTLKDELAVIEYIWAARVYRKSAKRLMSMLDACGPPLGSADAFADGADLTAWMRDDPRTRRETGHCDAPRAERRVGGAESGGRSQSPVTGARPQIALATDRNYFAATLVAMATAIEGASAPLDVRFLGAGLTEEDKMKLSEIIRRWPKTRIHYHELTAEMLKGAVAHDYLSATALAILQVPKLAEGKVLFLDSDLIVSGDVCELFDLDMAGFHIAAVRDFGILRESLDPDSKRTERFAKLVAPLPLHCLFNSGVVMFDNDRINQDPEIAEKLEAGTGNRFMDQGIMNACFKEKTLYIDNSWNVMAGFASMFPEIQEKTVPEEIRFRHQRPNVLHFTGQTKPWHSFDFDGLTPDSKKIADGTLQCAANEKCISEYIALIHWYRSVASRLMNALD